MSEKPVLICDEPCPVERGMRVLGGKWTGSILYHLREGPLRFNEISRQLQGASKKMIDQRLKELEGRNMVTRTVISDRPIAVIYELSSHGRSALDVLETVAGWCEIYETEMGQQLVAGSAKHAG